MSVIETDNLSKMYGTHEVLHSINMQIEPGRLVGFLGPNGAGKTTAIRILMGLLSGSSGDARIFGKCSRRFGKQIRDEIGYLPGDVYFYPGLSGQRTLKFLAAARKKNCDAEIKRLADVFDLPLNKTVRKYSTGMKQKLGLMQALMHRPQLLILDEPTSALDPLVRQSVFAELRNVVDEGRSVLFSSHSLSEVEELCDEVIILRDGHLVEQQNIDVLRERALRRVELQFKSGNSIPDPLPENIQLVEKKQDSCRFTWTGEIGLLIDWLQTLDLADAIIERPDLNDLFITYYTHDSTKAVHD